jgi:transcriptional regulator with XRE-family HTH domain
MSEDNKKRTILAKNLIRLRKNHGLTQEELSKISGVSRRTIALYETKSAKPPLDNIEKLAKALNVIIEELIEFKNNGNKLEDDFSNIDSRTLKKFKQILSLTPEQRHMVYSLVESLVKKKRN